MLAQIDGLTAQIGALGTRIEELIAAIPRAQGISADGTTGPQAGRGPDAAVLPAIDRLQEIPGISRHAAQVIIAEIGLDMLADRAARFEDLGDDYYLTTIDTDRRARSQIRQLQALGFTVTITPAAA